MSRIRVMIVEDSGVVREFLRHLIGRDPRLEVAAWPLPTAQEVHSRLALERVSPDVISMRHSPSRDQRFRDDAAAS